MNIHVQAETPPDSDSVAVTPPRPRSDTRPPGKDHPHVCPYCSSSFRRDEHLQRHIRIHTGEKRYRCPCNMTFARNDVFVRHMRICQPELSDKIQNSVRKTRCLNKTKRACDECAKAKAKCNYKIPCDRCNAKSINCARTRKGYEDPYARYSIVTLEASPPRSPSPANGAANEDTKISEHAASFDAPQQMSAAEPVDPDSSDSSNNEGVIANQQGTDFADPVSTISIPIDPNLSSASDTIVCLSEAEPALSQEISDTDEASMVTLMLPPSPVLSQEQGNSPIFMGHTSMLAEYDPGGGNSCNLGLDADPMSLHLASMGNLDLLLNPQSQFETLQGLHSYDIFSFQQLSKPMISSGFSLNRLDPLLGKCDEITKLLERAGSHSMDQSIYSYITRENMVHLCHLYGAHFQQNMSIIHAPTFDMAKADPALLLAVMLVGACYSPSTIPASQVAKMARCLLTAISLEPDETDMCCPSISLIQAGVLICCVLTCSNDRAALRSVRISVARNISMCERAGLLDPVDTIDYNALTEETFDWDLWIRHESGKRLACEIFCQDMVHCIFLGRTPNFDPCHFQVELPTYEGCWEAETAAECLRSLQTLPRPLRVSTAMTMLLSWPDTDAPLFEASGFGMFVLINALHFRLHQATQIDKDGSRFLSVIPEIDSVNAIKRLKEDFTGPNITAIADTTLKLHASPVIRRVDTALNAWHATWNLRGNRDSQHEHCTFKGDPLPFWWLAKLYLLLHYHGHLLQPDSEYASPRADPPDNDGKTMVQRKVVGWLSSFRGHKITLDTDSENWLPELMKLAHEDAN